jgi:hypothetical protein
VDLIDLIRCEGEIGVDLHQVSVADERVNGFILEVDGAHARDIERTLEVVLYKGPFLCQLPWELAAEPDGLDVSVGLSEVGVDSDDRVNHAERNVDSGGQLSFGDPWPKRMQPVKLGDRFSGF